MYSKAELKQVDDELRMMRFCVDSARDSIFWLSREGNILYVNDAACAERGYSRDEMLGMRIFDLDPDYQPGVWGQHFEDLKRRGSITLETRHRRKDGHVYPIEVNANYVHIGDQEFNFCFLHDITERKQAEQALQSSKERFKTMFVQAPLGIALIDSLTGRICEVNPRFASIAGRSMEEMTNIDWLQITHPDDVQADLENMALLNTGRINGFQMEKRYLHLDGTAVWIDMTISPLEVEDKAHPRHLCMIQDITERKAAEARIKYLSRVQAVLSGINALILRVQDRDELFSEACRIVVDKGEFLMSLVVIVNPSTKKIVSIASSGKDEELLTMIKDRWTSIGDISSTMVGQVISGKKPIVLNNSLNDPRLELRTKYAEAGVHSVVILPLIVSDEVVGTISLYASEIEFFHEEEMTLLTELAGNIAFAIDHLDNQERLNYLAFYDPLTRLPNRRLLMDRLQQAMVSSARTSREGALLLIDLDNFKTLNDTLGHHVGDQLLQQIAQRLEACVRDGDTVARLGGDEFVVILENLSEQVLEAAAQTESVGERILTALKQPYQFATHEQQSSASIGVTLFHDKHQAINELLKQADIAMYQAKKAGRNTLRFFDPEMQASINARASLESELRKALQQHQFQLHYQIQVDSAYHPIGAEVLIRWEHPERGMVSPVEFIPVAEETGLILPIGQWVLDSACAQIRAWQQHPLFHELSLAVNVSARQFRQPDFVAQVETALEYHGIMPRLLKLELTESMLQEDIEQTIVTMNSLKAIGVQFSLDDFGTGYSSLQYLKRLPLYQIKIDQSFVRDIVTDSSDRAIVRTIIAMAQGLSISVIAEGVETEEQRQFLLNLGCKHFQGYLFNKPVPIEQFEAQIKNA
jgi:diguanylate cyclase (GGDEF)-like protein/PAS domain S-box-containing protein